MSEPRLIWKDASGSSREVVLADETRIGRSPGNDVVVDDPGVSRRHALIRRIGQAEYIVIDLGSANGTTVNGASLAVPSRLTNGDVIGIGSSVFAFAQERDAGAAQPEELDDGAVTRADGGPREIPLLGTGPAMAEVFRLIERAARSTLPVLVLGETGTGKELVARGIHSAGGRAGGPFVTVSCAALADGDGVDLGAASGGTLLFDEVGDLGPTAQGRLLLALEAARPGAPGALAAGTDVRVLSSTNHDLAGEVERGGFRRDLFYRLAGLTIRVPALREHREDVPLLCERLLDAAALRHGKRIASFAEEALAALVRYDWPGNVRELEHEVERAVLLAGDGGSIGLADLSENVATASERAPSPSPASAAPGAAASEAPRSRATGDNVFRRDGEFWTLLYAGREALLKDNKGLHHIARLLREPWREVAVQELAREDHEDPSPAAHADAALSSGAAEVASSLGDSGPALDAQAKAEYRRRLKEVREDLEEAERDNDPGHAERARAEMDFLVQQLSAAVGLGGRDRPSGSHAERARLLVTQRIKAALKRVAESHPALGEHLAATIRTGYRCAYVPDPGLRIEWVV